MKVYQIIRKYIDDNGISLDFVADGIGMQKDMLCRILTGKKILKSDEFIRICLLLSLDLDQFAEAEIVHA